MNKTAAQIAENVLRKIANMPMGGGIGMPGNRGAAAGQRMMAAGAQGPQQATMPNKVPSMQNPMPGPGGPASAR